jgi:hypothetical protein
MAARRTVVFAAAPHSKASLSPELVAEMDIFLDLQSNGRRTVPRSFAKNVMCPPVEYGAAKFASE